jgi:hypothetical protein
MDHWVSAYKLYYSLDGVQWTSTEELYSGNVDQNTLTENPIVQPFTARLVRLYPESWHKRISMRAELVGCLAKVVGTAPQCGSNDELVGNASHKVIGDERIFVSSWKGYQLGQVAPELMWNTRIDDNSAGWSANSKDEGEWLGWDFESPKLITKVETVGNPTERSWVSSFKLRYTTDGVVWSWFDHIFQGNDDSESIIGSYVSPAIQAKKDTNLPSVLGERHRSEGRAEGLRVSSPRLRDLLCCLRAAHRWCRCAEDRRQGDLGVVVSARSTWGAARPQDRDVACAS